MSKKRGTAHRTLQSVPAARSGSPSRANGSGLRVAAFTGVVVVVLGLAAYFLWPVFRSTGPASPGAVTVQVSMSGYSPAQIVTKAGEPVTVRFVNKDDRFHTDGGGWHQFAIDELGVDFKIPPESVKELTFTPDRSGTFTFYCDVCCGGKENPYMRGTLAVGV